jgi:signal transduction histidine kinase
VPSGPSLLLVAPEGNGSQEAMREALPDATWTHCPSIDAAEAYLSAAEFDAVIVDEAIPEAQEGASALRERLGASVHVVRAGDALALSRAVGGAPGADAGALLEEVRLALGRAIHDVNNPMTVITGNTQYALELARGLDLDPSLVRALEDIEEAGQRLEGSMATLSTLRQRLAGTGRDGLGE